MEKDITVESIKNCILCPRECRINREDGKRGYCGMDSKIYAARAALHMWEEPCISGEKGSGAVFFSGCGLRCIFCQNREIAIGKSGKEISVEKLGEIFIHLEKQGAANINLVTGAHYVPQIIEALKIAKGKGLSVPIVYNSSGYEKVETLKLLEGYVNVYLPILNIWKFLWLKIFQMLLIIRSGQRQLLKKWCVRQGTVSLMKMGI